MPDPTNETQGLAPYMFVYLIKLRIRSSCAAQVVFHNPRVPGSTLDSQSGFFKALPDGGGNGNPLQYSCLETSMDRGA